MKLPSRTLEFGVLIAVAVGMCVGILLCGAGPRTAATAAVTPADASAEASPALVGLPGAPHPTTAEYRTALGIWDGAMMAGDASDASHWLAAGMLMSRGEYGAARRQLEAVLATAPAYSPLSLKAELLLAGTAGGHKLIALAFDDFPFANGSPPMLAALSQAGAPVTFFAIGHKVKEFPDLVALAVAEGDSIQNHTYHHVRLADLTEPKIREELSLCNQVIRDYTGVTPRYLRGPHAATNATVDREVRDCGLICVDPIVTNIYDMDATSDAIYARCLERAKPGAILAMHDGLPTTIKAMPRVIAALRAKGYQFVTVDQLLGGGSLPVGTAAAAAPLPLTPASALNPWSPPALQSVSADPDAR